MLLLQSPLPPVFHRLAASASKASLFPSDEHTSPNRGSLPQKQGSSQGKRHSQLHSTWLTRSVAHASRQSCRQGLSCTKQASLAAGGNPLLLYPPTSWPLQILALIHVLVLAQMTPMAAFRPLYPFRNQREYTIRMHRALLPRNPKHATGLTPALPMSPAEYVQRV